MCTLIAEGLAWSGQLCPSSPANLVQSPAFPRGACSRRTSDSEAVPQSYAWEERGVGEHGTYICRCMELSLNMYICVVIPLAHTSTALRPHSPGTVCVGDSGCKLGGIFGGKQEPDARHPVVDVVLRLHTLLVSLLHLLLPGTLLPGPSALLSGPARHLSRTLQETRVLM